MTGSAPRLELDVSFTRGVLDVAAVLSVDATPLALIGPNGAGKTSLLLAILGIVTPRSGRVVLNDEALFDAAAGVNKPVDERGLAYVPQSYGLFPHLTAADNIAFALSCRTPRPSHAERRTRALQLLEDFGASTVADRRPDQLSGGEKQRVALARAMATSPRALLFDEPVAALDAEGCDEIRSLLVEHVRRTGLPAIIVTHDVADVRALGAVVAVMERGRVAGVGALPEIAARPPTTYAAKFSAGG